MNSDKAPSAKLASVSGVVMLRDDGGLFAQRRKDGSTINGPELRVIIGSRRGGGEPLRHGVASQEVATETCRWGAVPVRGLGSKPTNSGLRRLFAGSSIRPSSKAPLASNVAKDRPRIAFGLWLPAFSFRVAFWTRSGNSRQLNAKLATDLRAGCSTDPDFFSPWT